MAKANLFRKIWSEALPFVALTPERKRAWLLRVLRKGHLTDQEIAPYIHLLIEEYQYDNIIGGETPGVGSPAENLDIGNLPREIIMRLLECAEIYDIPILINIIGHLTVDEAVLALRKIPPPYEKRPLEVFDSIFQAIHECDHNLLARARDKMLSHGTIPAHFISVYERFQEILKDKEVLSSLFPQAEM